MRTRSVLTTTLLASAVLTGTALAARPAAAAPVAATTATIRSAHLSPDVPGVDVYLSAFSGGSTRLWESDETYGSVGRYMPIPAGVYTVSMRVHGSPASTPPMLSWTLDAKAGAVYTAAAVGAGSARKGTVLDDDLTAPKPGKARVRLIQAASAAPAATVVAVHGPVVAQNTAFATATGYAQISAGTWPLQAASVANPTLMANGTVSVPAGSVTSILLLDKPGGGLQLRTVLDAAAAATAPKGAVPAGGGGTATSFVDTAGSTDRTEVLILGTLGLLGAGGFALGRRQARMSSTSQV